MIRVLHLAQDMRIGGAQRVVSILSRKTDRSRFQVSVLCLRDSGELGEELRSSGVHVEALGYRHDRPNYLAFLKVAGALRKKRIDILHTHNSDALQMGVLGAMLARTPTVVHTEHGRQFPDARRLMMAERVLSRFVHRVVGVSEHTTQALRRWVRIPPERLLTIPNGVEVERFQAPVDREAVRAALGIPPRALVLGMVSRLDPPKRPDLLLRAFAEIASRPDGPAASLHLIVAGAGSLLPALREERDALGLGETVHLLGTRTEIEDVYRALDLFVLSSDSEGLPVVVLEAMAAGLPVVASDVGGVSEVVRHGETGFLVPASREDLLTRALSELIACPDRSAEMGGRAQEVFRTRFSAEAMTRTYEQLYLRRDPT